MPVAGGVSSREEDHAFPASLPTYEDDGDMNGPEASVDGVLSSCKSSSEGAEDGGATVSAEEDGDAPDEPGDDAPPPDLVSYCKLRYIRVPMTMFENCLCTCVRLFLCMFYICV